MPQDTAEKTCDIDSATHADSAESARSAGLVFAADCLPGIRREARAGGSFAYRREDGGAVSDVDLRRIEQLAIPPAWTDVWVCADERGHLQATGRDGRGRKQYRYHDDWRLNRDEAKFSRMAEFGEALPAIRKRVDHDLRAKKLSHDKVLALVVSLMDETLLRVGNPEYARDNESFGLTTLRDEHANVGSARVRLIFRGKAGKELHAEVCDARLAAALRRSKDLPGEELFQYVDDNGEVRSIGSSDVNAYLAQVTGTDFTSKYFRTWGGTLAAADVLREIAGSAPKKAGVTRAIAAAAEALHNTPAIARRFYVHPQLIELYLSGESQSAWQRAQEDEPARDYLSEDERVLLGVLRRLSVTG